MGRMFALLTLAVFLFGTQIAMAEIFYVGTGTGKGEKDSKGIYVFEMNKETGKIVNLGLAAETPNPNFLNLHPTKNFLYACSEMMDPSGKKVGAVAAFKIEKDNKLTLINKQPSGGAGPCHVTLDKAGKYVFVANYGGGSVSMIPVKDDGGLGEPASVQQHKGSSVNKSRQGEPHAHSINIDPTGKFVIAADLGTDRLYVYNIEKGSLTPTEPGKVAPGSGPRHFAFHPNAKHAFVINELLLTVTSFTYDPATGSLTEIETISTVPKDADRKGVSTAEVVVHPSGKWVLGSNRGHNTIAVFAFDEAKGKLTHVGNFGDTVKVPRNFVLDPSGNFVLVGNQDGNSITVFRFNQKTGEMTRAGDPVAVPRPICLRFKKDE